MSIDRIAGQLAPPGAPSGGARPDPVPPQSAPAPAQQAAPAPAPTPAAALQAAVENVNRYLASVNQSLRFERDGDTGKTIVRVVDEATGDVLRQIPSEEVLDIARSLSQERGVVLRALA
jgi:flagellar protein FlaG